MTDSPEAVLNCPMQGNDAGAATVREYLVALLRRVWIDGEGFRSKRPFGNSGREFDIYEALGRAGMIDIAFDDDGYLDDCDSEAGDLLVLAAIAHLGGSA